VSRLRGKGDDHAHSDPYSVRRRRCGRRCLRGGRCCRPPPRGCGDRENRKLPETGSIPEGKYTTEEFEPAFSFRIEERGWQVALPEGQSTCSSRRSPPT
jgi:hypothetical protein